MCFSATASFSAGAVLTVIGIASIKRVQNPSQYLFAGIPLIFAVQQIAEGFLWLTLPNPDHLALQKGFTYAFLFFAQILWPVWVPLAVLMVAPKADRKKIQKILVGVGIVTGMFLGYFLIFYNVDAKISGHHILYSQLYPASFRTYGIILYILATIIPLYFSNVKNLWMLGKGILMAYIISAVFYSHYELSVWCFFAAIISITVYLIIGKMKKSPKKAWPLAWV